MCIHDTETIIPFVSDMPLLLCALCPDSEFQAEAEGEGEGEPAECAGMQAGKMCNDIRCVGCQNVYIIDET